MNAWTTATLEDVCSLVTDGTHHSPPNVASGEYRYVTAKNIRPWGLDVSHITYVDAKTHREIYARCPVEFGDVLYIKDGATTGIAALNTLREPFSLLSSVALLKPRREVLNPRYLKHWLNSPSAFASMTAGMTGTAIKRLVLRQIRASEMPIAPLEEQQRIADKLDTVLARVDSCRDRLARVAPLLKRFRQSVLAAATSGRLTEDWRGEGAPNWARLRAEDVCAKVQSGGTPKAGFTETTGIPFLKVYNIVNQRIDFEYRPQFVHPNTHAGELGKSRALPGDVVMNIVGPPLGKVAVLTDAAAEWNINQAITLFRPSERITSGWLYTLLCEGAAVRGVLDRTKGSVGQVNISLSQCRAFEFPVPTIEEQNEIVRRVEALFAFADRLEARLSLAQTAIGRLTPSLLAKAFRGELVPQDPADEPASNLLQRVQTPSDGRASSSPRRRRTAAGA